MPTSIFSSVVPFILAALLCSAQTPKAPATIRHFTHGLWFDGSRFVTNDFYVENGLLTHHPSTDLSIETIDLRGQYVVPPYGDAHEHNFDSVKLAPALSNQYLRDGIFYAQGMTDITTGAAAVLSAKLVNTPETVDVTYAHGGLTATNGHPKDTYEGTAIGIYYAATPEQREGYSFSSSGG